jgi:sporulation protein YlmC with PRC-barrel domain
MKRSLFILGLITMFLFAGQTAAQNTVMTFDRQAAGQFQSAGAMIGSNVVDMEGEYVGTIEDVLYSDTGVSYLIISEAETTGALVTPVPLATADPQRTVDGDYVIHVDRQTVASAPTYNRYEIGDMAEADRWENEVRGYFGVTPGTDQRAFRQPDIDATIESSKERGYHPYAKEFQNGERPRGYFGNIYDRHAQPDIDWTIESSKERGSFPQEFSDPETRAYFGEEYERRQPDIERTIESSTERGLVDP